MIAWILVGLLAVGAPEAFAGSKRAAAIQSLNEGVVHHRNRRPDDAETAIARALAIDPTLAEAHLALGKIQLQRGRYRPATRAFAAGLEQPRVDERILVELAYGLGRAHAGSAEEEGASSEDRRREREQAVAAFDRALAADPRHYRAHYRRARVLERLDDPERADASYRECIAIEPRYAPCFVSFGNMYIDYGFAELGIAVLERGVEVNDGVAYMWNGLGRAHLALLRPKEAIDAFEKAKAIDPGLAEVLFGLGMAYAELRQRREAVENLEAFLARAGDDVPEHLRRAASNAIARLQDVI